MEIEFGVRRLNGELIATGHEFHSVQVRRPRYQRGRRTQFDDVSGTIFENLTHRCVFGFCVGIGWVNCLKESR